MGKKNYYLVLDTETATLPWVKDYVKGSEELRKQLSIAKPLVYDIGWRVIDTKGNEVKSVNYLVQETFFVPNVFNTAYYKDKRPIYMQKLENGEISAKLWNEIIPELMEDAECCKAVCAYNAAFDFKKAIAFTERYIEALYGDFNDFEKRQRYSCKKCVEEGKAKSKNPKYLSPVWEVRGKEYPIIDIWDVACKRLINIDRYRSYCLDNDYWTASIQFFRTNAETAFKYLGKKYDFVESHTALDDVIIESDILVKALKKGKIEPCMSAFPFRELGTTVDYVVQKRKKSVKHLEKALQEYYNTCVEEGKAENYITKVETLLEKLLMAEQKN